MNIRCARVLKSYSRPDEEEEEEEEDRRRRRRLVWLHYFAGWWRNLRESGRVEHG